MIFLISIILVVFLLAWLLSATVRGYIEGVLAYSWGWILNHIPTTTSVVVTAVAVISIVILLPILLGVGWITIWTSIGTWALAPNAGWIIAIGGIIGLFALRWATRPLIFVALGLILFGLFFPTLKGALNRVSKNGQEELANKADAKILQWQPAGVRPAVVVEDAFLYTDKGEITTTKLEKGEEIRTVDLGRWQFPGNPETFARVMRKNQNGDFYQGQTGLVPIRKLGLDTTAPRKVLTQVIVPGGSFPQSIPLLLEGKYKIEFEPVSAATGAKISVVLPDGQVEPREINNPITIRKEEKGCGIWTPFPAIARIYAQ